MKIRILLTVTFFLSLHGILSIADEYKPQIAEASNDAELALGAFVIPEGMTGSLLAAEPDVANPVAFHITNDGRVFVCETFRQQVGVEDNRSHMDWLNNDLRLETVEERLAMFKKYLGDDIAKYAEHHDRIRLLTDTNGDGKLDDAKVFAQGFNDILDGTGAGILELDGKVYYTCIPKLMMLEDTDGDGKSDKQEALHHGYGVRVAFRGHDMHGLILGPDGRLYFSIGDRGYNVITKEGTRLKRPDGGAVFRCDVDGANLEVFAYGLRNPQELAFDNHGNLFTVDNNSDSGDQARLMYIVQDSDTGWRMYFQYLDDRGPWNRERMWYPYRADEETTAAQPAHIVPPLANISDGPSGFTFYPGLGLNDRYKDHFFLADFRGGSSNSGIRSFAVKAKGASFEPIDSHEFIWSILATDVDFAPDGSLYVSDWVNGWDGEGKGRIYRFEETDQISAVKGANVPELLNGGIVAKSNGDLLMLFSHADRRVRQAAQFELAKRDDKDLLVGALLGGHDEVTQRHVAWTFWQLGLKSAENATEVARICGDMMFQPGDIGQQYLRILTDLVRRHGVSAIMDDTTRDRLRGDLVTLMEWEDPRAAGFAAVALGSIGNSDDAMKITELVARNNDADPVVRHQCVMGLTSIFTRIPDAVSMLPRSDNATVNKAIVLTLSRTNNIGLLRGTLRDNNPEVVLTAARELMDERFGVGEEDVVRATHEVRALPALTRRGLEARYRLGTGTLVRDVAAIAASETQPEDIRLVACNMLKTWNNPQQTDTVNGRWRPLPVRETNNMVDSIRGDLAGMLAGPKRVRQAAVEIAAQYGIADVVPTLQALFADTNAEESLRVAAIRALSKLSDNPADVLTKASADSSEAIRITALEISAHRDPQAALPSIAEVLKTGSTKAQQMAVSLLSDIPSKDATPLLTRAFESLNAGQLPPATALDILNASAKHDSDHLNSLVEGFRKTQQEVGTAVALWSECLEGGDEERGKTVFFGRAAASCRRCHLVNGEGAAVGPDLSAVAKDKDRTYLLEAIVDPNAKIAKGFETTVIVDLDGRIHSGIIKEETDKAVKLMTPKGAIITVATDKIEERAKGLSGMPGDITKSLSRDDIRDLVEYLSSLKVATTEGSHGKDAE